MKVSGFFSVIILTYLSYSVASNLNQGVDPDYSAYLSGYGTRDDWEVGYRFTTHFLSNLGVDYAGYRLIFYFLSYLAIFYGCLRYTKNVSFFFLMYSISLFFINVEQTRYFFMMAFVFLGYSFFTKKTKMNYFIGTLFVLLGSSMHSSGYLFLPLVPLTLLSLKTLKKLTPPFFIGSVLFAVIAYSKPGILKNLLESFGGNDMRLEYYEASDLSGTVFLLTIFASLLTLITTYYILRNSNKFSYNMRNTIRVVLPVIYFGFFSISFFSVSFIYLRYQRCTFLFFLVLICALLSDKVIFNGISVRTRAIAVVLVLGISIAIFLTCSYPYVYIQDNLFYIIQLEKPTSPGESPILK
ncbi:MAG: EpsG family protein, partial [Micrococcaceae bacterium]